MPRSTPGRPGWSSRSLADLGTRVSAGQPLARLESADQRIALAQAQEKFDNTQQSVERQRALKMAGVVTVADSERVEFEHREALLELRKAQRDLRPHPDRRPVCRVWSPDAPPGSAGWSGRRRLARSG